MKSLSGAEILITGGAGFIGSNLAEYLMKKDAHVVVLDAFIQPYGANVYNLKQFEDKIELVRGDVRDAKIVKKLIDGKNFIFHLAGQTGRNISMKDPILDVEINSIGTLNVLNAIRLQKNKPKLIFASSRGVIGKPKYLPVDEKHPEDPRDIYGIDKLASEKYCLLFGKEYDFGVTALRLNNVYGPKCQIKSNHYGTVNLFIAYALQKRLMPIYGNGKQTRDYVYVDDVVSAFIASMSTKANDEFFFVGTGKAYSLINVVDIIKRYIKDAKEVFVPFPQDLKSVDFPHFYSTSKKIQSKLHWRSKIDLDTGIKRTITFYKKNLNNYL